MANAAQSACWALGQHCSVKWSGKFGQRAKMYPTRMNGYENDKATEFLRPVFSVGKRAKTNTAFKRAISSIKGVYQKRLSNGIYWMGIKPFFVG